MCIHLFEYDMTQDKKKYKILESDFNKSNRKTQTYSWMLCTVVQCLENEFEKFINLLEDRLVIVYQLNNLLVAVTARTVGNSTALKLEQSNEMVTKLSAREVFFFSYIDDSE